MQCHSIIFVNTNFPQMQSTPFCGVPTDTIRSLSSMLLGDRNVVSIDGYEDVPENSEAALMKAVAKQPVSVAICASGGLQFYSTGVVDGKCCTELDHGVLVVGYDVVCYASSSRPTLLLVTLYTCLHRRHCRIATACSFWHHTVNCFCPALCDFNAGYVTC